ncbi:uncharacterized protein LOC143146248 [Ptiloglossa arizonensis]|uniref:uncharacterized protein LOC143146248 n=1 Tax=Ptiloglossa arizonensis TaxID=3350558 RepID=UPI003FA17FF0
MNNATNYLSCIKIPSTNSKQSMTNAMLSQKYDIKASLTFNNELISLANRVFGEGKWNHTVTNQTIDFVEAFMGKYVCGCVTFVKIQLKDGTFHEDMGYCNAEGNLKGLSIYFARIGSLTDAFKKVLSCFGDTVETEIQKLVKQLSNKQLDNIHKEDLQCSIASIQTDISKPYAQSTPLIIHKDCEDENNSEITLCSKGPYDNKKKELVQETKVNLKSLTEQNECIPVNDQLQSNGGNYQKLQDNVQKEHQEKVLTEEERLRLVRKRKQMEKQTEYKKLMKKKEQQLPNENKKPNLKY